jgi:RimJ/RimL family protein N-acetyltransferase
MAVSTLGRQRHTDHVVVAITGGHATLRPLQAGETAPLLSVFARMSPESRASRYLVGMPTLPPAVLTALADVDGCDHVAWLATVDGAPAGIARYVRIAPDSAELAFEVVDAEHGRGLGTALLDCVTTLAAANGIRQVQAAALATNTPSIVLMRRIGIPLTLVGDVVEGQGRLRLLRPARVPRSALLAVARRAVQTGCAQG